MKPTLRVLTCLGFLASAAAAADVNGRWAADLPDRSGSPHQAIFEFQADGEKLTGKMSTVHGSLAITEGEVNGNEISFVLLFPLDGKELRLLHKGEVSGDQVKITRRIEGREGTTHEFIATRVRN